MIDLFSYKLFFRSLLLVIGFFQIGNSAAIDISFTDVADSVGLSYTGQSFGASWGDFDRDNQPDLYLSNHLIDASIYNNDGGMLIDVSDNVVNLLNNDTHAGAWADYDKDGDQDLAITRGANFGVGSENNIMLDNGETFFFDIASSLGLQLGEGRGRTPMWLDWNNDGRLDIIFSNIPRNDGLAPTTLFTQTAAGFSNDNALTGFNPTGSNQFATLFKQDPFSTPRLMVQQNFPFPSGFYDYSSTPFVNDWSLHFVTPIMGSVSDFIAADFDNDLQTEMLLSIWRDPMVVRQTTSNQVRAFLIGDPVEDYGFSFSTTGTATFSSGPNSVLEPETIKIGSLGVTPEDLEFELDATDPSFWDAYSGMPDDPGLFVHYDQTTEVWIVRLRLADAVGIIIDSVEIIEQFVSIGLPELPEPKRYVYLNFGGQVYFDVTNTAGLAAERSCSSSVAADFDNDMDLDLYFLCHDKAGNLPNQLMENNGSGVFNLVPDAAGALGTLAGVGDSVALADYDSDGFIDILVTNGAGAPPLASDGPTELFKNSGNDNNWLGINLRGTQSNAEGIGASVIVTANGVSQFRLQDGGMHAYAQNHSRLHFGLAQNNMAHIIEVRWPSGNVQILENVSANQFIDIVEPSVGDLDFDTIDDTIDNCLGISNIDQRDTDSDGFGNFCDPDHNNDCFVNFFDVQMMANDFLQTGPSLDTDINGDQVVNFIDAFAVINAFLSEPGPSALASCSSP